MKNVTPKVSMRRSVAAKSIVLLLQGVDTLILSNHNLLCSAILCEIVEKRAAAEAAGTEAPIMLGGREFTVPPFGTQYFGLLLRSNDIVVKTRRKAGPEGLPNLLIEFRSHFLWTRGWKQAALDVIEWIGHLMEPERPAEPWLISRVDPSLDLQGWAPDARDFMNFATQPGLRASVHGMGAERREKDQSGGKVEFDDGAVLYRRGGDVEGMRFGRDQIQLRIYNKTDEIRFASGKRWFFDLWAQAPGYTADDGQPRRVTRVEFQLRREALKSFRCDEAPEGINTIDDFDRARAALWRYLCGEATGRRRGWISLRVPTKDSKRSRWPVCPCWERVRDSVGEALPVVRVLTRRLRTAEAIAPSLAGYAASMAATLALDSGGDPEAFRKRVAGSDVFGERLPEKLVEYVGHIVRLAISDKLDEDLPPRMIEAVVRVIVVSLLRTSGVDKPALEALAMLELQEHDLEGRIRQRMKKREGFEGGGAGMLGGLIERVAADAFDRAKDELRESLKSELRAEVYDEAWQDGLTEAIRVFNGR